MAANTDAAFSRGDVMREIRKINERIDALETRRNLPHASYGTGGPRTRGGRFLAEDQSGDRVFEVTTEPSTIFMRPELITDLSVQILADRISFDTINGAGTTTGTSYDDLDDEPGPTVTGVEVSDSGTAIVAISARIVESVANSTALAFMGFEISGATARAPIGAIDDLQLDFAGTSPGVGINASKLSVVTDLNPGSHTFQAKYGALVENVQFAARKLIVIAL